MNEQFKIEVDHLVSNAKNCVFILAVSGGLDSMVLLHLFLKHQYNLRVVHCNFKLRGYESDLETIFIQEYCKKNNLPLQVKHFDTDKVANDSKKSIQITARELRYGWFKKIQKEIPNSFIVTAHHLNDSIETFLINSLRATGLKGLLGIPQKQNDIIRPLLNFTRKDILDYAETENVLWKEDSSNQSNKYIRNAIRHKIIPVLESLTTDVYQNFSRLFNHLQEDELLKIEYLEILKEKYISKENNIITLNLDILKENNGKLKLKYLLKDFGFLNSLEISKMGTSENGSYWKSKEYEVYKNTNQFELRKIKSQKKIKKIFFIENKVIVKNNLFIFETCYDKDLQTLTNEVIIDRDKLYEPLEIRNYKVNDFFIPLGMQGKKKVSKFLKDRKISPFNRENVCVLVNGNNEIIWVINHQLDNRYKVSKETKRKIKIIYK